jgi:hypothetical protein
MQCVLRWIVTLNARRLIGLLMTAWTVSAAAPQLQVNPDRSSLQYADGRPFFWMADTAWELLHRTTPDEADLYLTNRAEKQFTVILTTILAEKDGLRVPNRLGDLPLHDGDPTRPNESYFSYVDHVVDRAAELGLFVGLLPTWGDKVPNGIPDGVGPVVFDRENAYHYGRFLGARYRHKPVIWVLGGDRNVDSVEVLEIWRAMAHGLREGDQGEHLISFHPRGGTCSATWVHNEPWLDFNMYQSSHGGRYLPVQHFAFLRQQYRPLKPILESEPAYEDIPLRFWEFMTFAGPGRVPPEVLDAQGYIQQPEYFKLGYINDHDVRVHGYWNVLSGSFGYTYGNNAVWQMWQPGIEIDLPCLHDWKVALDRPGAEQMRWMRRLFERFPPASFEPNLALRYGRYDEGIHYVATALAKDESFGLAYTPSGGAFSVNLDRLKVSSVTAEWYNPRDGRYQDAGRYAAKGIQSFTPPSDGMQDDWVLVLTGVGGSD